MFEFVRIVLQDISAGPQPHKSTGTSAGRLIRQTANSISLALNVLCVTAVIGKKQLKFSLISPQFLFLSPKISPIEKVQMKSYQSRGRTFSTMPSSYSLTRFPLLKSSGCSRWFMTWPPDPQIPSKYGIRNILGVYENWTPKSTFHVGADGVFWKHLSVNGVCPGNGEKSSLTPLSSQVETL